MSDIDLNKADSRADRQFRDAATSASEQLANCINDRAGFHCPAMSFETSSSAREATAESPAAVPELQISDAEQSAAKILKPGDYSQTLSVDGVPRHFHLHVPPDYNPDDPLPLVLVLHGHGDDAAGVARISGMDQEADKKGFIVAYPEAVHWFGQRSQAAWDTGNGLLPPFAHADDVGFLRKVIDDCQNQLSIDPARTYLVGFSNGAMEAYNAAGELSDRLAAMVAVSGAMSGKEEKPNFPISVLSIDGAKDDGVPLGGRTMAEEAAAAAPDKMRMLETVLPILKNEHIEPLASRLLQALAIDIGFVPKFEPLSFATDFWKKADGITGPGVSRQDGAISTNTYRNAENGAVVEQEIVPGADHMIQHGAPAGFNLSDEIWTFLQAHRRS